MKAKHYYHKIKSLIGRTEVSVYLSRAMLEDLKPNSGSFLNAVGNIRLLTENDDIEKILFARSVSDPGIRRYLTKLYKRRLRRGDKCFLCLDNDICLGYLWVALGSVYIETVEYEMTLSNDSIAIYDVFTNPLFRGMGVYRNLLTMIAHHFIECKYAVLWVMRHNVNAVYAQSTCGFQSVYAEVKMISCCMIRRNTMKEVEYPMVSLVADE